MQTASSAMEARRVDPEVEYPHSPDFAKESRFAGLGVGASILGGHVYRGRQHPALRGDYLFADDAFGTNGRIHWIGVADEGR